MLRTTGQPFVLTTGPAQDHLQPDATTCYFNCLLLISFAGLPRRDGC